MISTRPKGGRQRSIRACRSSPGSRIIHSRVSMRSCLARMVGVDDPDRVLARVRGVVRSGGRPQEPPRRTVTQAVDEAVVSVEREVLEGRHAAARGGRPGIRRARADGVRRAGASGRARRDHRRRGTASAVTGPGWAAASRRAIAGRRGTVARPRVGRRAAAHRERHSGELCGRAARPACRRWSSPARWPR